MRIDRDLLWKAAFRFYFKDLFYFFYRNYARRIDWTRSPEFLDKELHKLRVQSDVMNRVADVLVRLYLKNGQPVFILLHIEIQGYTDMVFPFRFHQMRYRIEDMFGGITPAMLAIYTDDDPDFHPKKYEKKILGSKTLTVFNTYKVMENPPALYKERNSAVGIIMETAYEATQAKGRKDDEIIKQNIKLIRKLLGAGFSKKDVSFLLSFIQQYVKLDNNINYPIFEQKIDDMVKYETTEEILAFFDFEQRIKDAAAEAEQRGEARGEARAQQRAQQTIVEIQQKSSAEIQLSIREKEKERQEKEKERQEKEKERQEKEKERQEKEKAILLMLENGIDILLIAHVIGIDVEHIIAIQEKYKDTDWMKDNPIPHSAT
jgi:hypothetical protein